MSRKSSQFVSIVKYPTSAIDGNGRSKFGYESAVSDILEHERPNVNHADLRGGFDDADRVVSPAQLVALLILTSFTSLCLAIGTYVLGFGFLGAFGVYALGGAAFFLVSIFLCMLKNKWGRLTLPPAD